MSIHDAGDMAAWMACETAIEAALSAAERATDGRRMIGEVLCAALDTVGGGAPEYTAFGNMRDDAQWWADIATPVELEIYAAAALKRIGRATFAPRARKRIFMALWKSFTNEERVNFLKHMSGGNATPRA